MAAGAGNVAVGAGVWGRSWGVSRMWIKFYYSPIDLPKITLWIQWHKKATAVAGTAVALRCSRNYCFTASTCTTRRTFLEAPVHAVVHAPLGAVDGGFKVATAHFALEHGALVAGELVGLEGDGAVLPSKVSWPVTSLTLSPLKTNLSETNLMVGWAAALNRSALCGCLSNAGVPELTEVASKEISTLPVLPARSNCTVPSFLSEAGAVDRCAEVADFKRSRRCACRVDGVVGRLGLCSACKHGCHGGQCEERFAHGKNS